MDYHKYATFFPMMEGEEFDALVSDIKAHGLLEPIITFEDKILDGRNRYRACQKAGVEPKFKAYQGNGVLTYVVSMNVRRRHLSPTQLGVISLDVESEFAKEAAERVKATQAKPGIGKVGQALQRLSDKEKGLATEHAGKLFGISKDTVKRAKRVAKEAPDLLPAMRKGELTAFAAEEEVRMRLAKAAVANNTAKADKKARNENPREVKEYLDAIRVFCDAARTAKKVAAYGKFSPEAQKFTQRWHDQVRELMTKVEEEFSA